MFHLSAQNSQQVQGSTRSPSHLPNPGSPSGSLGSGESKTDNPERLFQDQHGEALEMETACGQTRGKGVGTGAPGPERPPLRGDLIAGPQDNPMGASPEALWVHLVNPMWGACTCVFVCVCVCVGEAEVTAHPTGSNGVEIDTGLSLALLHPVRMALLAPASPQHWKYGRQSKA